MMPSIISNHTLNGKHAEGHEWTSTHAPYTLIRRHQHVNNVFDDQKKLE